MNEKTQKPPQKAREPESTILVYVPENAELNFSNQPLPPPQPKYVPAADLRSGKTESWADTIRGKS